MSKSPDASRFVEWLRASRAHEPTPLPTSLDTLKALIADAMAFADDRAERAGGGAGHVYLGTVLHKMMENDSIDTFARNWLAGAITGPDR